MKLMKCPTIFLDILDHRTEQELIDDQFIPIDDRTQQELEDDDYISLNERTEQELKDDDYSESEDLFQGESILNAANRVLDFNEFKKTVGRGH